MKLLRRFVFVLLALLTTSLFGQGTYHYGNAWYQSAQPYIKLQVWEDGIWRVNAADLVAAGFDTTGMNMQNLQLWYRDGQEYMHVEPAGNGTWSFLEFYGRRNDGAIDSIMYVNPEYATEGHVPTQPNVRVSLFSDTSVYYLTYGNAPGLRYTDFSNTNYSSFTPESVFRYEYVRDYDPDNGNETHYNHGGGERYDIKHNLNTEYITGEGWMGPAFETFGPYSEYIPTTHAANNGSQSVLRCRIYRRSSHSHINRVKLDGTEVLYDSLIGVNIQDYVVGYSGNMAANTTIEFSAYGTDANNTDKNHVAAFSYTYDRLYNMDAQPYLRMVEFQKPGNAYLRFANANISTTGWVYDLSQRIRSAATANLDTLRAIVPGGAGQRELIVVADNGIRTPILKTPRLTNLSSANNGAEILLITHRSLSASALAYKNYRDTTSINPRTVQIIYTDEIYDEFSYGTPTPLAIKRMCKYAFDTWNTKPEFIFLWGKGQYSFRDLPSNMVPTWGYPATDYEFVANFQKYPYTMDPQAAVGRVNIYNNNDGFKYLEKLMQYEHTPWQSWMKNEILFGGGADTWEQSNIFQYLGNTYKPAIEQPVLGGSAWYFQNYNNGLMTNSSIPSRDRFDIGNRIVHFFGHSSSNIYDVDILEPWQYNNMGRYPLMIAFGCYGGDFTETTQSFGERFVLEDGKGSIGYLANSTAGFLSQLGEWGRDFYPIALTTHLNQPIGKTVQAVQDFYYTTEPHLQIYLNTAFQMNLQGDPSLILYNPEKPDYEITQPDVFIEPASFSASDSSFTLNVICHNLARVPADSVYLSVRQFTPQGTWITHPMLKFGPISTVDTLSLTLRNTLGLGLAGLNTFDIFVDSTDILDEYDETNNRISFNYLVPGKTPAILYPYDYAVIDTGRVKLAASTYVMSQIAPITYLFEIDTTPDFNSPLYTVSPPVQGTSFYAEWEVPFNLTDSTVYYWRVRLQDFLPASWATASFKRIQTRNGWGQSRAPQFFKDEFWRYTMNPLQREWEFDPRQVDLHIFTNVGGLGSYRLDNGAYASSLPAANYNGIVFTPLDSRTLIPSFTNTAIGDWAYAAVPSSEYQVISAIANMRQGDYFVVSSYFDPQIPTWTPGLYQALHQVGIDTLRLRQQAGGEGFVALGQKGAVNTAIQVFQPNAVDTLNNSQRLDITTELRSRYMSGHVTSTLIGPATDWEELIWDWKTVDPIEAEHERVSLYGIRPDNSDTLLMANLVRGTYSLAGIDPQLYPMLRLVAEADDSVFVTAPQLDHWYVVCTLAPDAIIDPLVNFSFNRDTLGFGESGSVKFHAMNLTRLGMDSLLVKFSVQRADRSVEVLGYQRYAPLPSKDTLEMVYNFNPASHNLRGALTFMIELNPDGDQPEMYHFNNLYNHLFFIEGDVINPLLDVTFNGKRIMEGDFVSPEPEILIQINDENTYVAVADTAFELWFGPRTAGGVGLQSIPVAGNSRCRVVPASLPENKAKLYFYPGHLDDGEYTLRVQGYDGDGNAAGPTPYEINFEVINESALTDVLTYPNPFSTSARFVYTLTGDELPDVFEIHVFTVSGKLVKVIDLAALGEVRYGKYITEYSWDGTDEFGDMLANGVYVYKVVAKINGEPMKYRDEGVSEFFRKGFGKLYIMR